MLTPQTPGALDTQGLDMVCANEQRPARGISVSLFAGEIPIIQTSNRHAGAMYNGERISIIDEIDDVIIDGIYLAMEYGLRSPDNWIAITSDGITYTGTLFDKQGYDA